MEYPRLVQIIAEQTGLEEEQVRAVLNAFPEALMKDEIGAKTRTPLGVFTIVERSASKPRRTPTGQWGTAKSMILARLKPGKALQRERSADEDPQSP